MEFRDFVAFAFFHRNGLSQSALISSKFQLTHQKKFQQTRGDKAAEIIHQNVFRKQFRLSLHPTKLFRVFQLDEVVILEWKLCNDQFLIFLRSITKCSLRATASYWKGSDTHFVLHYTWNSHYLCSCLVLFRNSRQSIGLSSV